MRQISIAILEPNPLFREGLRQLLTAPDFAVTAAGGMAAEAFLPKRCALPELILWGPGCAGDAEAEVAWVRRRSRGPHRTRLVLVCDLSDVGWLRRVLMAGVDAILSEDISPEVLQRSLSLVVLGQQLFPAELVKVPREVLPTAPSNLIPFPKQEKREQTYDERGSDNPSRSNRSCVDRPCGAVERWTQGRPLSQDD